MYQILNRNKEKTAYFVLFTFLITIVLLVSVAYKNDEEIKKIETNILTHNQEFILVKQFLLNRLRSPFTNINYYYPSLLTSVSTLMCVYTVGFVWFQS